VCVFNSAGRGLLSHRPFPRNSIVLPGFVDGWETGAQTKRREGGSAHFVHCFCWGRVSSRGLNYQIIFSFLRRHFVAAPSVKSLEFANFLCGNLALTQLPTISLFPSAPVNLASGAPGAKELKDGLAAIRVCEAAAAAVREAQTHAADHWPRPCRFCQSVCYFIICSFFTMIIFFSILC